MNTTKYICGGNVQLEPEKSSVSDCINALVFPPPQCQDKLVLCEFAHALFCLHAALYNIELGIVDKIAETSARCQVFIRDAYALIVENGLEESVWLVQSQLWAAAAAEPLRPKWTVHETVREMHHVISRWPGEYLSQDRMLDHMPASTCAAFLTLNGPREAMDSQHYCDVVDGDSVQVNSAFMKEALLFFSVCEAQAHLLVRYPSGDGYINVKTMADLFLSHDNEPVPDPLVFFHRLVPPKAWIEAMVPRMHKKLDVRFVRDLYGLFIRPGDAERFTRGENAYMVAKRMRGTEMTIHFSSAGGVWKHGKPWAQQTDFFDPVNEYAFIFMYDVFAREVCNFDFLGRAVVMDPLHCQDRLEKTRSPLILRIQGRYDVFDGFRVYRFRSAMESVIAWACMVRANGNRWGSFFISAIIDPLLNACK